jgi:hypothetical protein
MTDYSNISVNSINCDKCSITNTQGTCNDPNCVWIPENTQEGGKCIDKCGARSTKGQCGQYHEWNRSKLTPVVYDFSGHDNKCEWYPYSHSIDDTVNSKEGDCRPKYINNDSTSISSCFEDCNDTGTCDNDYTCINFKEGPFCVPNNISDVGDIHCGYLYNGHHNRCYLENNNPNPDCVSIPNCEKYIDSRVYDIPSDQDNGVCVSDGSVRYDLDTGENLGLIMSDEQCGEIIDSDGCMNYRGYGCLWEPFNEYCVPTIDYTNIDSVLNSCKPIEGHVPGNYDINMIEEEHLNVSEFRDRNNNKYPYITSKYLCDVCHIRDNDLDNMKEMSGGSEEDQNNLKYYMIKEYVDFNDGNSNRSSSIPVSPQEYCEKEIDDTHDNFNPCVWDTSGDNSTIAKGGKCVSKCNQHSPVDSSTTNSQELKYHKDQCISEKWYPDNSVRGVEFPNLIRGSEASDDYFKDRYCTWDGYECHNSIPCKFAQQTRCEDLGYEWYEGSALDIMNQPDNESLNMGIPLDLSTSYPIVRKGDGKPVEGDMDGVCIYPNIESGYISTPTGDYIINPEFIGNQVIMLKWREYGSGWWEDMSCKRKINGLTSTMIDDTLNNNSYFLGENVALIPFRINQGDRCDDIKTAINNALQNYQYFVYNGEWVVHAEDIIHAIDRSYDSCIDEVDLSNDVDIAKYQRYYGYMYYSNIQSFDQLISTTDFRSSELERKHLNAIYDLRGSINILPVLDQHCALEITNFSIDSNTGDMSLVVKTKDEYFDKTKFEFVEFIGTEIFSQTDTTNLDQMLQLTVLSKYNYTDRPASAGPAVATTYTNPTTPNNIVQGYGTLYENLSVKNIERSSMFMSNIINLRIIKYNDLVTNRFNMGDNFYVGQIDTLIGIVNTELISVNSQANLNDKIIILNNITSIINTGLTTIIDQSSDTAIRNTKISTKNTLIQSLPNIDLSTSSVNHVFDIRNINEFNTLKSLLNLFSSDSLEFDYSEIDSNGKTPIEYWAVYNEFKNYNVFSQPTITLNDELNKAEYIPNPLNLNQKKLCSGSLESWKIQNEGTAPVYQTMDLKTVNGLLKIMAGYLDDSTIPSINDYFNVDLNGDGTLEDISIDADYRNYIDSYQQTDITKSILWSITRNTPPFWGNLFYNRGSLGGTYNDLYICSGNFNTITLPAEPNKIYGRGLSFNYNISDNTLFKPFCEASSDEASQNILWKNIMSYTGGNKREIQLSRNVKNDDYNAYIEYRNINGDNNSNRNYYDTTGGGGTGNPPYYMGLPYDDLKNEIEQLSPIIALSKRDYLIRSLNDWKRILYDYPDSGNIYNIPTDNRVFTPRNTLHDSAVDFINNSSNTDNSTTHDPGLHVSVEPITYQTNLNDFIINIDNAKYTKLDELLLAPVHTGTGKGGQGVRQNCHDYYYGELGGITSLGHSLVGSADARMSVHHSGQDDTNLNSDRNAPKSDYVWEYEATRCTDPLWDTSGLTTTITPNNNQNYLSCCQAVSYNDLTLSPTSTSDINPFKFPRGDNTFTWDGDIDPRIYNKNIESLYRLTNIEKPSEVGNNSDDTDGILKSWGKIDDNGQSYTENLDLMWSYFNTTEQGYGNIINRLIYPNDNSDITISSISNDTLRKWCMSSSDSLDPSTFDKTSNFDKSNNINPNNPENQMGILYSNWLNNNSNINNYKVELDDDLFSGNKNYNAHNYPNICEPWLLKVRDTGSTNSDYAYYLNTHLDWGGYYGFDPVDDLPVEGVIPDFSRFNTISGNGGKWTYENVGGNANITDDSDVFGLNNQGTMTFDGFTQEDIVIDKDQLISEDYGGTQPVHNNLYNMLHPLSITAARPREKIIYIDITPNNDIFNLVDEYINPYYFENSFDDILTNDYNTNLDVSNVETSILNNYEQNKYFLLYPGVGGTTDDIIEWNSTDGSKIGSSNYIIGKNSTTTINITNDKSTVESRANFHVSYFKFIYELIQNQSIIRINTINYKFDKDYIQLGVNNNLINMKPNDIIPPRPQRPYNNINISIFYNNNNILNFTNYYISYLPPKGVNTIGITNELFGSGYSTVINTDGTTRSALQPGVPQEGIKYILPEASTAIKYFNINMVFPTSSTTEEIESINICKDLIKSKLTICGNTNNWTNGNCEDCFEVSNPTNQGICSNYPLFISGNDPSARQDDVQYSQKVGVCGVLENNLNNKQAWNYIDVTQEPETFGSHLPTKSPYDITNRNCNNLLNDPELYGINIDYLTLEHSGVDTLDNVSFFKPARSSSSDIFEDSHSSLESTAFGCMRKDLSLMKGDDFRISCNTSLSRPVERDKHVLINFIIYHDPTNTLNASERTKLAIMSEEELLNKALDLGININEINEYTRPRLQTKVRDTFIPNLCEDGITLCPNGTDAECPGNYRCGLYEEWNDLQKYYYNIHNNHDKLDFTSRKEWTYVGCGIDLNYSDNSSGESICKDKYPGLCQQNIEKCDSDNPVIRDAIHLDCPETCKVQYNSLDQFKQNQSGSLSICTSRGRCKWSHDMDPSNLLPLCEEHTSRELGTIEKCRNYNSFTDGPESGSCNLKLYPETIDSTICAEQRCTSMQGCVFTPQVSRICTVTGSVDERIINEEDCPEGGRWLGSSIGGQCILPERNYYDSDLQDFEEDCNILGGSISSGSEQACEYHPDLPYTGEDPCSHIIDLDDLTYDEQLRYFYRTIGAGKIYVSDIVPEKINDILDDHPKYLKIILDKRLNTSTIQNYDQLLNLTTYPKNKYIYIDNNTESNSLCSQYLLGKSKIVKINNIGPGTDNTEIIIGGPDKAYILPLDTDTGKINIGGLTACEFRGLYDLERYAFSDETSTGKPPDVIKAETCYNNTKGACNYEYTTENCVSCGMYKDEVSCFGNNDPDEFSHCGWGSIKDMCGVIGEMDDCVKMHMDGCEWNPTTQKCSLNKLTDDDGNPLVDKVGCVKCDDMLHKNTCNSMKNCFWDALTTTDAGVGTCRACSSIRPDNNDRIDFTGLDTSGITNSDKIDAKCDNFQLTKGRCEFREPINKDTGIESLIFGENSFINGLDRLWGFFDELSLDLSDDEVTQEVSVCESEHNTCKCSPTREYPVFPDWIIHNLTFLLIFTPFAIYFMIAWYNVLISPSKLVSSTGNNISSKISNVSSKISNVKDSFKGIFKNKGQSGGDDNTDEVLNALKKIIDDGSKKSWFSKQKDKIDFSIFNTILEYFDTTVLHLPDGSKVTTDWVDFNVKGDFTKTFSGILNPEFNNGRAQFAEMIPKSDLNFKKTSLTTILKLGFLILSLPFTIIQYLSRNLRLAPAVRIGYALFWLGDASKSTMIPFYINVVIAFLCYLAGVIVVLGGSSYLFLAGFKVLKQIIELGLVPNHNYVDPVDGVTHRLDGKSYPAAAYWPKRLYREEWDDMIKDPISDEVIEQRESILPGALQGDINDEDNVSDVYKMAYLEIEPESLNWTQWFRDAGKTYNKFINRIGDNFIFTFIVAPYLLFKYITTVKKYLPIGNNLLDIKSFVVYTFFFAFIFGLLSVFMSNEDPIAGEYDGVETKCYGDIESPFKLGNEPIHYPKVCFGESIDASKNECPYGCYYVGIGDTDPDYGKKCKDNRSALSLGSLLTLDSLEPEPTLNIPFDKNAPIPDNWTMVTPEVGKSYACPPTSRFMSAYPYDTLCHPTAKRCKSSSDEKEHNDICEILYMKNDYNDEKCRSNFIDPADIYSVEDIRKSARGEWEIPRAGCELETPYQNYAKDNWCPFPLPAAENDFFSEQTDTRDSVSLWEYMYDKISNPGAVSSCSYNCVDDNNQPRSCTPDDYDIIATCKAKEEEFTNDTFNNNNDKCEGNNSGCTYYPERVPLQTSLQNQERYLIVNQEYGNNLFS